jgi:hypothetical protein
MSILDSLMGYVRRHLLLRTAGVCILACCAANATLLISFQAPTATAGSTGNSFDITLLNNSPSPLSVAAFTLQISTSNPNVGFTGATSSTTAAPYIFGAASLFGPNIATSVGQTLVASDIYLGIGGVLLPGGGLVGLGHVFFDVAPGAANGIAPVTFDPIGTSLADDNGTLIAIGALQPGQIIIAAVPEPGSAILILTVLGIFTAARRNPLRRYHKS